MVSCRAGTAASRQQTRRAGPLSEPLKARRLKGFGSVSRNPTGHYRPSVMLLCGAFIGLHISFMYARPLEEFRFPTFLPGTHNNVYCNETDSLEKSGKASITFMNRYRNFYGCPA